MIVPETNVQPPRDSAEHLAQLNRAILASALDCIITMDAAGFVREFNPAAERVFGYTRDEAVGRELAELIVPPSLRDRHRHGLAHYLRTGEGPVLGRRIEIAAVRRDGCEILVELAITAFRIGDEPLFTAYLRDITERVRTERRRVAQYSIATLLGIGIDPEHLEKIFDAFEQVNARREGLGLGLAISKAVVEMHGGTIRAASSGHGQGASFRIDLPLRAKLPE